MLRKRDVIDVGCYNGCFQMEDYYLWICMLKNGCECQNLKNVLLYMCMTSDPYNRRGGRHYAMDLLKPHLLILKDNSHISCYISLS